MIVILEDGRQIFVTNKTIQMLIYKVANGYLLDDILQSIVIKECEKKEFESLIEQQVITGKFKEIFAKEDSGKTIPVTGLKGKKFPLRVQIEITRKCNLNCLQCYKIANEDNTSIYLRDVERLLNIFTSSLYEIGITGGEPTTHKDFVAITELVAGKAFKLALNTNGILLSMFPADVIKRYQSISISLYGTSDEEYSHICNKKDAFSDLKKSTQYLRCNGINFGISVLLDKENILRIEEYIILAIELGASSIQFGAKAKIGRGKILEEYIPYLDNKQIGLAYRIIREMKRKYVEKIEVKEWYRDWFKKRVNFQNTCFSCEAGSLQWVLTEKTKFKPCVILPEIEELEFSEACFLDYINFDKNISWDKYYTNLNNYCRCRHMEPEHFCDRIKGLANE